MSTNHTSAVKAEMNKNRQAVYDRDGHACVVCGSPDELQLDHIVPLESGGDSSVDNLQTMCRVHNREKSDKTWVRAPMIDQNYF